MRAGLLARSSGLLERVDIPEESGGCGCGRERLGIDGERRGAGRAVSRVSYSMGGVWATIENGFRSIHILG